MSERAAGTTLPVRRLTHDDRVLAALRTGPKNASELYALGCIAHSRVASLRKKGYVIECVRVAAAGGASSYRYTLNEPAHPVKAGSAAGSLSGAPVTDGTASAAPLSTDHAQLVLA